MLGADVTIRDRNSSTCLHMALCDHTTIDFSSFPKLRKSTPQDLDESPSIAKVRSAHYIVSVAWFVVYCLTRDSHRSRKMSVNFVGQR